MIRLHGSQEYDDELVIRIKQNGSVLVRATVELSPFEALAIQLSNTLQFLAKPEKVHPDASLLLHSMECWPIYRRRS
jgi:hypothetical protein